jgi:hypothetical protein
MSCLGKIYFINKNKRDYILSSIASESKALIAINERDLSFLRNVYIFRREESVGNLKQEAAQDRSSGKRAVR